MIDPAAYKRSLQQDLQTQGKTRKNPTAIDTVDHSDEIPDGNFVFLLPSAAPGFDLRSNKWHKLSLSHLTPVEWNKSAFSSLALEHNTKEMIQALLVYGTRRSQKDKNSELDVLHNDAHNLVMLFHGSPGTGKTFAAESVAELAEKPIQTINIANMGTNVAEMDRMVRQTLSMAAVWDIVILFDDADVLLEERSTSDLSRNAMVAAFLRILDDLKGIVILTTNRVQTLDPAFKSRIHLTTNFQDPDVEQRHIIWCNLIGLAESQGTVIDVEGLEGRLDKLARVKMNGRQIRNVLSAAQRLAAYRGAKMGYAEVASSIQSQTYSTS
jgi:SpoVK/Ycf46/Vps4 family AAA+-type ATPase